MTQLQTPTAQLDGAPATPAPKKRRKRVTDAPPLVIPAAPADRIVRLKPLVSIFYDLQKMRVAADRRVAAAVQWGRFDEQTAQALYAWSAAHLGAAERELLGDISKMLPGIPVYDTFLSRVYGIGPTLSAAFMAAIHPIARFATVAALWSYAGQAVVDGHAQRRQAGVKVTWNPWLRMMCWRASDCFVKQGRRFKTDYDNYYARCVRENKGNRICPKCFAAAQAAAQAAAKTTGECPAPTRDRAMAAPPGAAACLKCGGELIFSAAHRHAMARRYIVKLFLSFLWEAWRTCEGLPVRPPHILEHSGGQHTTWRRWQDYCEKDASARDDDIDVATTPSNGDNTA